MNDAALHLEAVSKRYPHFLLDRVDLRVERGSVMGFLGANGAGKSTTMRILMGLVRHDSGSAMVLGCAMPAEQARAKQDIGYVSEDLRLYPGATLQWHLDFVAAIYPCWDGAYAALLLRRFDLRPAQKIKGMSHGQRVKSALLLALARRPRLLVLDEPTTGLDPVARHEVLGALMEAMADEERSVLYSSHNTAEVEQIADAITFIDRGRIVDAGDKESYLDRWRRLRLDVPPGVALPAAAGIVSVTGAARLRVLTTRQFDPALVHACEAAGARVLAIESLSLEEIFVANVMRKREELQ